MDDGEETGSGLRPRCSGGGDGEVETDSRGDSGPPGGVTGDTLPRGEGLTGDGGVIARPMWRRSGGDGVSSPEDGGEGVEIS